MKLKVIFYLFLLGIILFSCNEDATFNPVDEVTVSNDDFAIKDGILYFHSSNTFYKTIEKLDTMDVEQLENWLYEIKFYNSLYLKMKELEECTESTNDGFSLVPGDIRDQSFAALLNEHGLISIGDTISYLTKYIEYVITDGDLSMVDRLKENPDMQYANIIKHQHKEPNLKSSWGWSQFADYVYIDSPTLVIKISRWKHIYFWTHTSNIVVELVHDNNINKNESMGYCSLDATGEFCTNDKYDNCSYQIHTASGTVVNRDKNDKRIYRNTGSYGFCSRNITVSGEVQREGNDSKGNAYPRRSYTASFTTGYCVDID